VLPLLIFSISNAQIQEGTVSIELDKTIVRQGEFLPFNILINKTRGPGADASIEYWIESMDGGTWIRETTIVYISDAPAFVNLSREVYIFSIQPPGNYLLKVKLKFSNTSTDLSTNKQFYVAKGIVNITTTNLNITEYPIEISAERGWSKLFTLKVRNSGDEILHNLTFTIDGIENDWYTISPEIYDRILPNTELVFSFRINVPPNATTKNYEITMRVSSAEGLFDVKKALMRVFTSAKELAMFDMQKLEVRLNDAKLKMQAAIFEGRNTSSISLLIQQAEMQLNFAKQYLEQEKFDQALIALASADELLTKSEEQINNLPYLPEYAKMNTLIIISYIVLITIPIIAIYIYHRWSEKRLARILSFYSSEVLRTMEKGIPGAQIDVKKMKGEIDKKFMEAVKEKIAEEKETAPKEKIKRLRQLLKIIEKEYAIGNISKNAYDEIKEKCEERLKALESREEEK
ncbi:MAG: hypothetical protein OH354_01450, partial [Candidatus Parvarchaeota archaeon]|nr:hypothetical protein [Candidatus Jingweiarchaeum tengchongense]